MPSYARTVKAELARKFDAENEYLRAELAALLKVGGVYLDGRIDFATLSAAVARKLITLQNKLYPCAKREVSIVRKKILPHQTRYFVRIFLTGVTEKLFAELDSPAIVEDDYAKVAYLRGAFLACGTVNKPEAQYYLDISTLSESAAVFVNQLLKDLEFNPAMCVRREFFVNYICEGDAVEEFLGMVGAAESLERFQIARNLKEVRSNVNRLVNCETSNLNRSVATAQKQIAEINFLLERKVKFNDDLKNIVKMRLKYPDITLTELARKLFLTRQALSYQLKKVHDLAEELSNVQL